MYVSYSGDTLAVAIVAITILSASVCISNVIILFNIMFLSSKG